MERAQLQELTLAGDALTSEFQLFQQHKIPYSQPQDHKLAKFIKQEMASVWQQWDSEKVPSARHRPTITETEPASAGLRAHRYRIDPPLSRREAWEQFLTKKLDGPEALAACTSKEVSVVHNGPTENGPLGTEDTMVLQPNMRTQSGCGDAARSFLMDHTVMVHDCTCEYNTCGAPIKIVGRETLMVFPKFQATKNRAKLVAAAGFKPGTETAHQGTSVDLIIGAAGTVELFDEYAIGVPEVWDTYTKKMRGDRKRKADSLQFISDSSGVAPLVKTTSELTPGRKMRKLEHGGTLYYPDYFERRNVRSEVAALVGARPRARPGGSERFSTSTVLAKNDLDGTLIAMAQHGVIAPMGPGFVYAMLCCSSSLRKELEHQIWRHRAKYDNTKYCPEATVDTVLGRLDLTESLKRPAYSVLAPQATKKFKAGAPPGLYLVGGVPQLVVSKSVTPRVGDDAIKRARDAMDDAFKL